MKLSDYIPKLERLASPEFMETLKGRIGDVGLQLIDNSFKKEQDPYDGRWAEVKAPARAGTAILYRTGNLRGSFTARPSSAGVVFSSSVDYAQFHQYGTRNMVSRSMLPKSETGLGEWEEPIKRVVADTISEELK